MAGLYLQAQQGDMEGLQEQLRKKLEYFDENLSEQIRQTSALANIKDAQVKSLLAVKISEMQGHRIFFQIEVPQQVEHLGMNAEDCCRGLGILIDNAMEAAIQALKPQVQIAIPSFGETVQVEVKNTFGDETPSLDKIWADGFSTKGTGRGAGLAILKRILARYENVMMHTSLSDERFIQQLTINTRGVV